MTQIPEAPDDGPRPDEAPSALEIVQTAEGLCGFLAKATLATIKKIQAENTGDPGRVAGVLTGLAETCKIALKKRDEFEKLRQQQAGVVHDYALDFERARIEILGRLGRIRAAGGDRDPAA
jgi:hypothetical protein